MHVLVTGGAGYIGSVIAARQKARGDHAADVAGPAGDQDVHAAMLAGRSERPIAARVAGSPLRNKKGGRRAFRRAAPRRTPRCSAAHFLLSTQIVMTLEFIAFTWMRTPRFLGIFTPASGSSAYQ